MGKQGPCHHCGATSTPLWRNGPPEKPVLCNACGSRWRTKGTLVNYTPLHARLEPLAHEDSKPTRLRKQPDFEPCEEGSNRSSSGSAISNSESCEMGAWDALVPSRKRTCFTRPKFSSVEKLAKDLHTILHEQQYSCVSGSSEEDLLFGNASPIGHGSCLIKRRDEESEASSQKPVFPKRGEIPHFLENRFSPLCFINLSNLVNYEMIKKNLTREEQEKMVKYLPETDSLERWEEVFESKQFKESLCAYQGLLAEGVFDQSFSDDCEELVNLVLHDLSKGKWIEHYNRIKSSARESKEVPEASCWFSDTSTQAEEICEQDLLLDVPSNGSFAQAELLNPDAIFDGKRRYG